MAPRSIQPSMGKCKSPQSTIKVNYGDVASDVWVVDVASVDMVVMW